MKKGILKHAAVTVATEGSAVSDGMTWEVELLGTHERTKRSRFNQSGFLGLNFMYLLKRTWAIGAIPLYEHRQHHVHSIDVSSQLGEVVAENSEKVARRGGGRLTWEHRGVPSCC